MREWRNANDNNHCHDCSVLLPEPEAQARQDTAVHVSLSVSTMSNSYPKVLFAPTETAPTGGLARQLIIGLERISIDSTQMPMEQEKPAGQKCAPRLLIDPRRERCVYGPHRLVSKGFFGQKKFFCHFFVTTICSGSQSLRSTNCRNRACLSLFDASKQAPSACAT